MSPNERWRGEACEACDGAEVGCAALTILSSPLAFPESSLGGDQHRPERRRPEHGALQGQVSRGYPSEPRGFGHRRAHVSNLTVAPCRKRGQTPAIFDQKRALLLRIEDPHAISRLVIGTRHRQPHARLRQSGCTGSQGRPQVRKPVKRRPVGPLGFAGGVPRPVTPSSCRDAFVSRHRWSRLS
jgi:hypothetical protein